MLKKIIDTNKPGQNSKLVADANFELFFKKDSVYFELNFAEVCSCGADSGLILGLHPANERRRYKVTPSLIGWAQTWNQPWYFKHM